MEDWGPLGAAVGTEGRAVGAVEKERGVVEGEGGGFWGGEGKGSGVLWPKLVAMESSSGVGASISSSTSSSSIRCNNSATSVSSCSSPFLDSPRVEFIDFSLSSVTSIFTPAFSSLEWSPPSSGVCAGKAHFTSSSSA